MTSELLKRKGRVDRRSLIYIGGAVSSSINQLSETVVSTKREKIDFARSGGVLGIKITIRHNVCQKGGEIETPQGMSKKKLGRVKKWVIPGWSGKSFPKSFVFKMGIKIGVRVKSGKVKRKREPGLVLRKKKKGETSSVANRKPNERRNTSLKGRPKAKDLTYHRKET